MLRREGDPSIGLQERHLWIWSRRESQMGRRLARPFGSRPLADLTPIQRAEVAPTPGCSYASALQLSPQSIGNRLRLNQMTVCLDQTVDDFSTL
jgi:hypothetical protein